MSIEPAVPYSKKRVEYDDDDEDWRDHDIYQNKATTNVNQRTTKTNSNFRNRENHDYQSGIEVPESNRSRNADDHWVIPTNIISGDLVGSKRTRFEEIRQLTGAYLEFNRELNQIDIWGDVEAIDKAKGYLNTLATQLIESDTRTIRKTKKWSKPDRELTEKERRRAERRQAKVDEQKRYQGLPAVTQDYTGSFVLPDTRKALLALTGQNEAFLNQIRADCKAYIWYEPRTNKFMISSDIEENLDMACQRLRNLYLRTCRRPVGDVLRLVQQPKHSWNLRLRGMPPNFVTHTFDTPEEERRMLTSEKLLESVNTGQESGVKTQNLINLEESGFEPPLSEFVQDLDKRNKEEIETQLMYALESIRLNDWVIRMKIRFGQICLINYPQKEAGSGFYKIEEVSDKIFRASRFVSALAPCISKDQSGIRGLFDFLNDSDQAIPFSDNPQTSFTIDAEQYPYARPPRVHGQREPPVPNKWFTSMHIAFTPSGQRRLWNTITEATDLVDISVFDMESHYCWDLRLQHARRLPNDDFDSPHEKFSNKLRVSPSNRLIMVISDEYDPLLVTQKTKWKFEWKKGYVIEICQDEMWDMNRVARNDKVLPVDLSTTKPHRSLYKVSMYKESWVDRFAQNLNLKVGEAPNWTINDFLARPDDNVKDIMATAKEFNEILRAHVPLYWENSSTSLV